ncbi:Mediator of RNA polymerase II transcription subunit 14 [Blyttiomyces sp. JEL0837]|nr:Mediator of RNA polymerase II transcription subunit 14 [Blyttiomyces sp. JEL0837]
MDITMTSTTSSNAMQKKQQNQNQQRVKREHLPVMESGIPLRDVIGILVQKAYAEFQTLTETLPNATDAERKKSILAYTTSTRQTFLKLLVLVRWSKSARMIQDVQNIMAVLDGQDSCFSVAADALVNIHNEMKGARDPNYDMLTAAEILVSENYARLPTIIKKSTIPPPPLTPVEIDDTLSRVESIMRIRLLVDEVVPAPFRKSMVFEKGCVTFRVDSEFEVTLSLDGNFPNLPWKVVEVKLLVKANNPEYEAMLGVMAYQADQLKISTQQIIAQKPPEVTPPVNPQTNQKPDQQPPPPPAPLEKQYALVTLYTHLHRFCLSYRLRMMHTIALHLSRTRWKDQISVEVRQSDPPVLAICFWTGGSNVNLSLQGITGMPLLEPRRRYVMEILINLSGRLQTHKPATHVGPVIPPLATQELSGLPSHNHQAIEHEIIRSYSYNGKDWEDYQLQLKAYSYIPEHVQGQQQGGPGGVPIPGSVEMLLEDPWTKKAVPRTLDPSEVDVEKLLLHVAEIQARYKISHLRDILLRKVIGPRTRALAASRGGDLAKLPKFKEHEVVIVKPLVDAEGNAEAGLIDTGGSVNGPSLDVFYRPGRVVRLSIDIRTGLVIASDPGETSAASAVVPVRGSPMSDKIRLVEARINASLEEAPDALFFLRFSTLVDQVESFANLVGLQAVRQLPVDRMELRKLRNPPPEHVTFLKFQPQDHYYLGVAVANLADWSRDVPMPGGAISAPPPLLGSVIDGAPDSSMTDLVDLPVYRVWIISIRKTMRPNMFEISNVEPIANVLESNRSSFDVETLPSLDSRKRKREEEKSTIVPGLAKFLWKSMNVDTISRIMTFCRKQIAWSHLSAHLQSTSIAFSYVPSSSAAPATQFLTQTSNQPAVPSRIPTATEDPKICIPGDLFNLKTKRFKEMIKEYEAMSPPAPVVRADEKALLSRYSISKPNRLRPFGNLFMTLDNVDDGSAAPSDANGVTQGLGGALAVAGPRNAPLPVIAFVRLRRELLPPISLPESVSLFKFNPEKLYISFDSRGPNLTFERIFEEWNSLAAVAQITSDYWLRQKWFRMLGFTFKEYTIQRLVLAHSSSISVSFESEAPAAAAGALVDASKFTDRLQNRFVVRIGFQDTIISEDGAVHPRVSNASKESYQVLQSIFQQYFANVLDMVAFAKAASPCLKLMHLLTDIEMRRNLPENWIDNQPLIFVQPKSISWIRLVYGPHAIDFHILRNNTIGMFDSCFQISLENGANVFSASTSVPPLVTETYSPIAYFSDATESAVIQPSFISHLCDALKDSKNLVSEDAGVDPEDAIILPLPHGAIFSPSLLRQVQFEPFNFRIMFSTKSIIGGYKVSTDPTWKLALVSQDTAPTDPIDEKRNFKLAKELLGNQLVTYLNDKLNALPLEGLNLRPFLQFYLDFALLPHVLINDFLQISKLERMAITKQHCFKLEWCLFVPDGAPGYLPPPGMPATVVDRESSIIKLALKFTLPETGQSKMRYLKYNYGTGVVAMWNDEHDPFDLTEMQESEELTTKLKECQQEIQNMPHLSFFTRLFVQASGREVPVDRGGPGKLFIVAKHLCSKMEWFNSS